MEENSWDEKGEMFCVLCWIILVKNRFTDGGAGTATGQHIAPLLLFYSGLVHIRTNSNCYCGSQSLGHVTKAQAVFAFQAVCVLNWFWLIRRGN